MKEVAEFRKSLKDMKIPKRIIHCRPETPFKDVLEAMKSKDMGAVVITTADRIPLGIITERDILKNIAGEDVDLSLPIETYMTPKPTTVNESEDCLKTIQYMELGGFRRLIVVDDDGKLSFVVSLKDLVFYLYKVIDTKGL